MNKRQVGSDWEQHVTKMLSENGYQILAQNYRCRRGEVDIIANKDGYLVFIEVKQRSSAATGLPLEAVNDKKQKKISTVCAYYLMEHNLSMDTPVRFDVVSILGHKIQVIENAFEYRFS